MPEDVKEPITCPYCGSKKIFLRKYLANGGASVQCEDCDATWVE